MPLLCPPHQVGSPGVYFTERKCRLKRGQVTDLKITQLSGHGARKTRQATYESTHKLLRAPLSIPYHSSARSTARRALSFPTPVRALLRNREHVHAHRLSSQRPHAKEQEKNIRQSRTSCHVFPVEIYLCLELLCSAFLSGKTEMPSPPVFPLQADKHPLWF